VALPAVDHYLRAGTLNLPALPPLSLYVHLPWCLKKCPYCDFNSHELTAPETPAPAASALRAAPGHRPVSSPSASSPQGLLSSGLGPRGGVSGLGQPGAGRLAPVPEARYLDALCADLEAALPLVWGRPVVSVFIGGGTPSLFSPDGIDRLLADIRARLPLVPDCEITLEANPGTFERDRFRAFRAAGVTRLSVGVQSFDDQHLRAIGRVHDAAQAHAAVAEAKACFDTFNIDLMYALPGQTLEQLRSDLDTALMHAPPHLSVYHLTLEPNTFFASHPPDGLPDADAAADMLDAIIERTSAAALQRYEVSAFARAGHRCRHNLNYWRFGDYLGIGAGAHGKLSFPHRVMRQVRWREPKAYMEQALAGQAVSNERQLSRAELPFEFMLNALRLREGFHFKQFSERTGLPLSAIDAGLRLAGERGLIETDLTSARASPRGFDFLNDLQAMFLPPAS
jgi:oxygen-independent coproporphyrinogen-3 oxidase